MEKRIRDFYLARDVVLWEYLKQAPSHIALRAHRFLNEVVQMKLDRLLRGYLRAEAFISLYFRTLHGLRVRSEARLRTVLHSMVASRAGVLVYGDVAYLKIANTSVSENHGDWMLRLVGSYLRRARPALRGRFRTGDEFILYSDDSDRFLRALERAREKMREHEVVPYLPVSIDIGYAEHREVAQAYIELLDTGWEPTPNRSAVKVFFDIALKIAKDRCDIQKVVNRGWVLYFHYQMIHSGDPEIDRDQLNENMKELVRGGRFIEPDESWLEMDEEQFGPYLLTQALALLGPKEEQDQFDQVTARVAESIYLD